MLTAAHCIESGLVAARVGELTISSEKDCEHCPPAIDHEIEKVLLHTKFLKAVQGYDLALIKLKERVNITGRFVKTICLPVESFQRLNKSNANGLQGMGFGKTKNSFQSDSLMKVTLPLYPLEACKEIYPPMRHWFDGLVQGQMCAGNLKEPKKPAGDTCMGMNEKLERTKNIHDKHFRRLRRSTC